MKSNTHLNWVLMHLGGECIKGCMIETLLSRVRQVFSFRRLIKVGQGSGHDSLGWVGPARRGVCRKGFEESWIKTIRGCFIEERSSRKLLDWTKSYLQHESFWVSVSWNDKRVLMKMACQLYSCRKDAVSGTWIQSSTLTLHLHCGGKFQTRLLPGSHGICFTQVIEYTWQQMINIPSENEPWTANDCNFFYILLKDEEVRKVKKQINIICLKWNTDYPSIL